MGQKKRQPSSSRLWALTKRQHGVVARTQLLRFGFTSDAINHRLERGRLHRVFRGVYAVGRPELSKYGRWMAAVLSCGSRAALSHGSAAALWEIRREQRGDIAVSVPARVSRRQRAGIRLHRRALRAEDLTRRHGIPVTGPVCTLVDLAARLRPNQLEAVLNEADKRDLIDPEALRSALEQMRGRPGVRALRTQLDRRTFTLTDSELERRFLPIARLAGLGPPQTGRRVSGFRVDFYWPDLGLVVETDGLRYHRTPAQQAKDRLRDQVHAASGLTCLRFTHAQVTFETDQVESTLASVGRRLSAA